VALHSSGQVPEQAFVDNVLCVGPCVVVITAEKNQLDATYYFIVLLIGSTCFGHYYAHHQELATIMLITTLVVSFCKDERVVLTDSTSNCQSTTLKTHHTGCRLKHNCELCFSLQPGHHSSRALACSPDTIPVVL